MVLSTSSFVGTLALFVYFGAVLLSWPAAAGTLMLARRFGVWRAAAAVAVVFGALVFAVSLVGSGVLGMQAALTVAGTGIAGLLVTWVVPVAVGTAIVRRSTGVPRDRALGFAVAGLPPALIVSALLFVASGGPTRYNLTFLTGPLAWVYGAVFVAVVLFGPGLAGVGLHRIAGRGSVAKR